MDTIMDTTMRAKINVAIVQKEDGHLVLKIYNGYGDPEIPFVSDSVQLEEEVNLKPRGTDHKIGTDCHCRPTVSGQVVIHR